MPYPVFIVKSREGEVSIRRATEKIFPASLRSVGLTSEQYKEAKKTSLTGQEAREIFGLSGTSGAILLDFSEAQDAATSSGRRLVWIYTSDGERAVSMANNQDEIDRELKDLGISKSQLKEAHISYLWGDDAEKIYGKEARTGVTVIDFRNREKNIALANRTSNVDIKAFQSKPNPFSKGIDLALEFESIGQTRVSVFDVQGRLVKILYDGIPGTNRLDLTWTPEGQVEGIYMIKVNTSNGVLSRNVIYQPN